MKRTAIVPFFALLLAAASVSAQTKCYEKIKGDGLRHLREKNYAEAINQFWLAIATCPDIPPQNNLNDLIKQATNEQIKALETKTKEAEIKAEAERIARATADSLKIIAEKATQQAKSNEQSEQRQRRRAEILRLAAIAENLRQKGQRTEALAAAAAALHFAGDSLSSPTLRRVFAETVRDSFSEVLFSSPDGKARLRSLHFLSGGSGQKMVLQLDDESVFWADFEQKKTQRLLPPSNTSVGLKPSKRGNLFLTWNSTGDAQIWNAADASPRAKLSGGHSQAIRAADFSADEKQLLTGSRDNSAKFWTSDGSTQPRGIAQHAGNIYQTQFLNEGKILTRSSDGTAAVWDTVTGQRIAALAMGKNNIYLTDCAVSEDGSKIAIGTVAGEVWLGAATGEGKFLSIAQPSDSTRKAVKSVQFSNGRLLIRAGRVGQIRDVHGKLLGNLKHPSSVAGLVSDPFGSRFVTWTSGEPTLRFWSEKGQLLKEFSIQKRHAFAAVWSSDGALLLLTMRDGSAVLTDREGNILCDWVEKLSEIEPLSAAFSSDGQAVLCPSGDGKILLRSPLPEGVFSQIKVDSELLRLVLKKFEINF